MIQLLHAQLHSRAPDLPGCRGGLGLLWVAGRHTTLRVIIVIITCMFSKAVVRQAGAGRDVAATTDGTLSQQDAVTAGLPCCHRCGLQSSRLIPERARRWSRWLISSICPP